jgi:hypothetical protein
MTMMDNDDIEFTKLTKDQLEQQMWELNYNYDAIYQAQDILEEINEELESGNSYDLEEALDNFGIFHRRIRTVRTVD